MYEEYNRHDIAVYAGFLENDAELLECTSGGIATALARHIIQRGGYVAGVAYSGDFYKAEYKVINQEDQLDEFKGSKYIEVEKGDVFHDVKTLLDAGERVLFFGLPCIVGAVKSFLKREYDNLITCELVCHGPTSPKVHTEYVKHLENRFGSRVTDFSVRKKREVWTPPYLYAKFENGREFERPFYSTEYGYAFSVMGRGSCYDCKFKGNNRMGDIMIGDFWGAKPEDIFWNDKGVSVIFVHTDKGKELLHAVEGIRLFETTFERAVSNNPMVIQSKERKPEREKFKRLLDQKGLIYAAYHSKTLKGRIKATAARFVPGPLKPFLKTVYLYIKKAVGLGKA